MTKFKKIESVNNLKRTKAKVKKTKMNKKNSKIQNKNQKYKKV